MKSARRSPWLGRFARRLIIDVLSHISVACCAGTVLFLVVDFVEVGNRAKASATAADFGLLSLLSIPMIFKLIAPVGAAIGTFTAIGAQMRRLEIAAFFASGASPLALFKPLVLAGLVFAGLYAGLVETLIPPAAAKTNIVRRRMGLPYAHSYWGRNGWYKGKDQLYRVRTLARSDASQLKDVLMLKIKNGKIVERTDVGVLTFKDQEWVGQQVVRRILKPANKNAVSPQASMHTVRLPRQVFKIAERPKDFNTGLAIPKQLAYAPLYESAQIREKLGRPALAHRLELHHRHTGPLSILLVILIAGALCLRNGLKQSLASAMGAGAALGFSLWLVHELATLIGSTSALPTWGAAHILPFCLGIGGLVSWFLVERRGIAES